MTDDSQADNILLEARNISKNFSGVQALKDVSLSIKRGEILCLAGENGSGKSTLIKTIAGVHAPDQGQIIINGQAYERIKPREAINAGIQVIYQDFSLFPNLSVAENLAINYELSQGRHLVNWLEVRRVAKEALAQTEIEIPLGARVGSLSVAEKQLIAISRAMLQNASLIFMDEPTTALTEKEVEVMFRVIKKLQAQGVSIFFVSHKLKEVMDIAERVVVMRNGEKVVDAAVDEFDQQKIAYYMTGQEISYESYQYTPPPSDAVPLLQAVHLSRRGSFEDVNLELYPGEILGVTGLLGSGRTALALSLFGAQPAHEGSVFIDGELVKLKSIQDALKLQIGYVPEDRLTEGLFLEQSIGDNIVVRNLRNLLTQLGIIKPPVVEQEVVEWVDDLSIKTNDPDLPVRSLSGGNQQRVVLAKWLASDPRILILNSPTVGVDVGSKSELHHVIRDLAKDGMGVMVISDDIPEILQLCNRVLLMRAGKIVGEYQTADMTEDSLSQRLRENTPTPA